MDDKEYYEKLWHDTIFGNGCSSQLYFITVVVGVILFFCSCATKTKVEYVDREVVKYNTIVQHDTLIRDTHDSIYHTIFQKGDTVYDTKYVERTRWRDRVAVKSDTCFRDSIQIQIKETVVEKTKIPKWCWYCLGFTILGVIFAFVKIIRWVQIH
jgi:hypothetical protein